MTHRGKSTPQDSLRNESGVNSRDLRPDEGAEVRGSVRILRPIADTEYYCHFQSIL